MRARNVTSCTQQQHSSNEKYCLNDALQQASTENNKQQQQNTKSFDKTVTASVLYSAVH
jgi:hypothetical protein